MIIKLIYRFIDKTMSDSRPGMEIVWSSKEMQLNMLVLVLQLPKAINGNFSHF